MNPYGNVGPFIGNSSRPTFGRILANPQLVNVSKNLKTFTEGVVGEVQEEIRDVISEADVVAYLGFGYLPLNMQVISSNRRKATQFVVGTTKGLSRFSNKVITERLVDEIALNNSHVGQPNSVNLMDLTCSELMHEFEMMFLT